MAERQFGPYRLVRQIAVGGMAEIHLARAHGIAGFEKYVALKMIHPNFSQDEQFIQMLIDEAKITVQLQHVNIAQTFDLGRVDETFYITMEFVDGADLYKLLRVGSEADKDVPLSVAAFVAKEVAAGLDYAHRKRDIAGRALGIVHRDVSPQNVLISHTGEVKIVDFGIAKATMRARQTQAGVIKGKYYYMSPEQAWGENLDHRTDIFSTGIILYEMLTGQMLYLEEDLHRLLDMVRRAEIDPPTTLRRDVPPQLEQIVMRALQRNPNDRYQSAGAMGADLERFLHAHAPVFTAPKVAAWVADVLGGEGPVLPAVEEVPDQQRPGYETRRLTRDQLVLTRQEFEDENSIIFGPEEIAGRRGDTRDRLRATVEVSGALETGEGPTGVRKPDHATLAFETDSGAGSVSFADEESDATIISGPPGFEGEGLDGRGSTPVPRDPTASTPPIETSSGPDSADTEFNVAPTLPTSEDRRIPPPANQEAGSDLHDLPTSIVPGDDTNPEREQPTWRRAPALVANNPKPAVSALRTPRASRRTPVPTPGRGMPVVPNAQADLRRSQEESGSMLSSLLSSRAASRRVAISSTSPTRQGPVGPPPPPPPGIAGSGGPGFAFPPPPQQPGPGGGMPYGQFPGGGQPYMGTATRLAAFEVDEIPDAFKVGRASAKPWTWILLALFLVAGIGGFVAVRLLSDVGGTSTQGGRTLTIVSVPDKARVFVDNKALPELTPTRFEGAVAGKSYVISIDLDGYKRWEKEYPIPEGGDEPSLLARLDKVSVFLQVTSAPTDAEVILNNKSVGRTPMTLKDLDPGAARTIEIRKPGFRSVRRTLDWSGESEKELNFKLER